MKYIAGLLSLVILAPISISSLAAQTSKKTPVVIELFTSEGCSTCPPADKYLQKLLQEQPIPGVEIIALSEHVDYWNRPEWTDKFSSAQFSNRQKYYAVFFKRNDIYTPQMVIDGTSEITVKGGSKMLADFAGKSRVDVRLSSERVNANLVRVKIKLGDLPQTPPDDRIVVLTAITEDDVKSNVGGGENNGQKMVHTAVTRFFKNAGEAQSGGEVTTDIEIGKDWNPEKLSIVVFVQEAKGRGILGAAKIGL